MQQITNLLRGLAIKTNTKENNVFSFTRLVLLIIVTFFEQQTPSIRQVGYYTCKSSNFRPILDFLTVRATDNFGEETNAC